MKKIHAARLQRVAETVRECLFVVASPVATTRIKTYSPGETVTFE